MEIREWSIARELDVVAADYIQSELVKREIEREKRDRNFWIAAFGGQPPKEIEDLSEEEAMAKSALRR